MFKHLLSLALFLITLWNNLLSGFVVSCLKFVDSCNITSRANLTLKICKANNLAEEFTKELKYLIKGNEHSISLLSLCLKKIKIQLILKYQSNNPIDPALLVGLETRCGNSILEVTAGLMVDSTSHLHSLFFTCPSFYYHINISLYSFSLFILLFYYFTSVLFSSFHFFLFIVSCLE